MRYSYSVPRDQILAADAISVGITLYATITPISQSGRPGGAFSMKLTLEPVLTPLPADDANLELSPEAGAWNARMRWRQPILPQARGISPTAGWQLVLRPLVEVPLGAYPEQAIDTTERGLMSTTGQALIEGDIIVPLADGDLLKPFAYANAPTVASEPFLQKSAETNEPEPVDEVPPAERELVFHFVSPKVDTDLPFFDHTGQPLAETSRLYRMALGFFRRESADTSKGHSWRLFLRAVSDRRGVEQGRTPLPAVPVSGLAPVRLTMAIRPTATLRPLPYFEWPPEIRAVPARVVARKDLKTDADMVHVPTVYGNGNIVFVPRPGRERLVTVQWTAIPSDDTVRPLAAVSAYVVHEIPFDGLVNFDLADLGRRGTALRRVLPAEASRARSIPSTLVDTQNWEAQYPVFARTCKQLELRGIAPDRMRDVWPGTWSWSESELVWPDALSSDERSAFAAAVSKVDPSRPEETDEGPMETGEAFARQPLHAYLALLLGLLHDLGTVEDMKWQVDVQLSPPSAIRDPAKWLAANTQAIDPYGWAALATLGLSVTFSLRDPVTGQIADQGLAFERLEAARQRITILLAGIQAEADSDLHWALKKLHDLHTKHVMVELPLQPGQAFRAAKDRALIRDVGLALVQVSLRPIPQRLEDFQYDIVRLERLSLEKLRDGKLPDAIAVPGRVEIIHANGDRPQLLIDEKDDRPLRNPAEVLRAGDVLLVRQSRGASLRAALEPYFTITPTSDPAADLDFAPAQLAKAPVACHAFVLPKPGQEQKRPPRIDWTPFGRFDPLDAAVHKGLNSFGDWITLLATAFAVVNPADPDRDTLDEAVQKIKDTLTGGGKLVETYRDWAARFFATAPIGSVWGTTGGEVLEDGGPALGVATAQPKSVEPVLVAADGQGVLRIARFVDEELATSRGYSVTYEKRYDRLLEAIAGPPDPWTRARKELQKELPRRDIYLPRVRALEAPAILSARSIRARDGRPFNEIVVTHTEWRLTESNTELAAKLEFGDVRRSYSRTFARGDYLRGLKSLQQDGKHLLDGVQVSRALTSEENWSLRQAPPDLRDHDQSLLHTTPAARWGATRYQDAAEPFYYRQTVTVEATAARGLMTEAHSVVLPSAAPDPLVPLDDGPTVSIHSLTWEQSWELNWLQEWTRQVRAVRAGRQRTWSDRIRLPEPQRDSLRLLLGPMGLEVEARLPRYAESLSPDLRKGAFQHEITVSGEDNDRSAPAGLLPDEDARLIVADLAPGETFTPIVQVVPTTSTASVSFAVTLLSGDYETPQKHFIGPKPPPMSWVDGVFAHLRIRPAFQPAFIEGLADAWPPADEIDTLVQFRPDRRLKPNQLPRSGGLVRLAPLALRLFASASAGHPDRVRIALASPLAAPRWVFRPFLDAGSSTSQVPGSEADLAVALRLLLDPERRQAAALVAWDVERDRASDGGLLRLIEESAFACLLERRASGQDPRPDWLRAQGFQIWERVEGPNQGAWRWQEVTGTVVTAPSWKVALITAYNSDNLTPARVDANLGEVFPWPATYAQRQAALQEELWKLAGRAHRSQSMRQPVVFAQRGNAPRVRWSKE